MNRYPLENLLARLAIRADTNEVEMAELLCVERNTLRRWKRMGGIRFDSAEWIAEKHGFVPYEIWDEWLAESAERGEQAEARRLARRRRQVREAVDRYNAKNPERVRAAARDRMRRLRQQRTPAERFAAAERRRDRYWHNVEKERADARKRMQAKRAS